MYDLDNIKRTNPSFKRQNYSDYVVTTASYADNETRFIFVLEERRNIDLPPKILELNTGDYKSKNYKGLTTNQRRHI